MSKILNLLYSTRCSSYNGTAPAALWTELMKPEASNILETFSSNAPSVSRYSTPSSGCELMPVQGASWISPGTQIWVIILLQISMKLVQTELDSMSQATRKGTGWTQHPTSFVFIAKLGQQQQRPSKIQVCWEEPQTHGSLSASVLLSGGFLQAEKVEFYLKKRVFCSSASSAQCAANLLMGEWVPGATCLSLGRILKCLFQDPLTQVQVMKQPRELLPLWMCISLHVQGKVLVLHTTFAGIVYQVVAEQKGFGWFKILVIRYSRTLFYMKNLLVQELLWISL